MSPQQYSAIDHLVAGYKYERAAEAIGVDTKTLFRWRQHPAFQAELTRCRMAAFDNTRDRIVSLGDSAVKHIRELIPLSDLRGLTQLMRTIGMLYKEPLSVRTPKIRETLDDAR